VTIDPETPDPETTGGSNSPDALLPDSTQNGTVTTENDNSDDENNTNNPKTDPDPQDNKTSSLNPYSLESDSTILP
jgi:hypothetical protein